MELVLVHIPRLFNVEKEPISKPFKSDAFVGSRIESKYRKQGEQVRIVCAFLCGFLVANNLEQTHRGKLSKR